jgi:hypothetical protein
MAAFQSYGVLWLVIVGIASLFWLWMLVDAIKSPSLDSVRRIIWICVIFFLHFLGALVYFLAGRQRSSA